MNRQFVKHEIEVLKAFSLLSYFGEVSFDSWVGELVILNRDITPTGLYLSFMEVDCIDELNESDFTPFEGQVSIESACLENGAGFMLYKAVSSECIFSLEGYTYGGSWLLPDCDFKIVKVEE